MNFKKITIRQDYKRLKMIIASLVHNAIKFSKINGNIIILIEIAENLNEVFLKISDDGMGMKQRDLKILESYSKDILISTATNDCSGIGLCIRVIIFLLKLMAPKDKVDLKIESEINKGSSFAFYLKNFDKENDNQEMIISSMEQRS